jgi:hypothetical protein
MEIQTLGVLATESTHTIWPFDEDGTLFGSYFVNQNAVSTKWERNTTLAKDLADIV